MKYFGAHVSAAGGVFKAPANASAINADSFALFTKNQKRWNAPPLTEHDIHKFKAALKKSGIQPEMVLPHDSYLINLGNPDPEKREKSLISFIDEVKRCEQLGLTRLNFHPGSYLKQTDEQGGLELIADSMKQTLNATQSIILVIENTAGQGSTLGYSWEHLGNLIDLCEGDKRVGICIDTCHAFAAGYDFKNDFDRVFSDFETIVGFDRLKGMHLNDSRKGCGSRIDRHESIGKGEIGEECFKTLVADPRFDDIPLILETPDPDIWAEEIALLKQWSID